MRRLLLWRLPREPAFWWPERQFLVGAKKWRQRWIGFEPASSSRGKNLNESNDDTSEGVIYATWNDWSWKDGSEHGAKASQRGAPMCGVQPDARTRERVGAGESDGNHLTPRFSDQ